MRILVINWQDRKNPFAGGAEVHLHQIFARIASLGHTVTLLCSSFEGSLPKELIDGIEVVRLGGWRNAFNFTTLLSQRREVTRKRFDVVVEDINKIPFYAPLWARCPVLALVPHLFGKTIFEEIPLPLALYVYLWELPIPQVYRNSPFAVISESTKQDLVKRGIRAEQIEVIPCGLDSRLYYPGDKKADYPLICHLGRLKRYKRIDILLRAMTIVLSKMPEARLTVMGDGDARKELVGLSEDLDIGDRVAFRGVVSQEEKVRTLQESHVLVNTSPKEGWGLTGVEAMGCGTPVVASNSPGLRDSVVHGVTGFLVEHGDVQELARRITQILEDKTLRERLSKNGVKWVQRFSWDSAAQRTLALLEEVVAAGRRR